MSPRALPPLALLVLGSACASDSPPTFGEQVWSGEHVEVWATDDATICAGSFEALDRHAELLTQEIQALGVEARDEPYRYYWLGEDEYWDSGPCREPFRGCTVLAESGEASIYGFGFSAHELVHAEFATEHQAFFDEGVAMMFGDASSGRVSPDDALPVPSMIDDAAGGGIVSEHYGPARLFVGAMAEFHPDEFLPALLSTRRDDDFPQADRRLTDAGIDVPVVLDAYAAQEVCTSHAGRVALLECAVEPEPWAGEVWQASGVVDCDALDTMGPSPDGDTRWTIRSVDIAEAGRYTATFETDDALIATMVYCDAGWCSSGFSGSGNSHTFFPTWHALLDLQVGRYWFRVEQDMDDPDPGVFELTLVPGW